MHVSCLGADSPNVWDKVKSAASGVAHFSLDTLKNVSPIVQSYYNTQTARANARAVASGRNVFPKSMTDKDSYLTPGVLGAGVGMLALVGVTAVLMSRRGRGR